MLDLVYTRSDLAEVVGIDPCVITRWQKEGKLKQTAKRKGRKKPYYTEAEFWTAVWTLERHYRRQLSIGPDRLAALRLTFANI